MRNIATSKDRKLPNRLIGDFLFDLESEQFRHRILLHRNIMRMLAHHQKRRVALDGRPQKSINGTAKKRERPASARADGTAEVITTATFPEPKRRSLRTSTGQSRETDAELVIELKGIRKKLDWTSNFGDGEERPLKRVKRVDIQCQCHLAIWDNRDGFVSPEPIVKRTQLCSVAFRDKVSDHPIVDIKMYEPFTIKSSELLVPMPKGEGLKLAVGEKYFLEVKIVPCDTSDAWPPIPVLRKSEGSSKADFCKRSLASVQGALVSGYTGLPQTPSESVPLSVSFVYSGRAFETKFGLAVSGKWATLRPDNSNSPAPTANGNASTTLWPFKSRSKSRSNDGERQNSIEQVLPMPPPSKPRRKPEVSYVFDFGGAGDRHKDIQTVSIDGYGCVACRATQFQNLAFLLFHLNTWHHKYTFKLINSVKEDPLGPAVLRVEFTSALRPNFTALEKDRQVAHRWVAPKAPLDIDAFNEGDHSWLGLKPRGRPPGHATGVSSTNSGTTLSGRPFKGFLPTSAVPELPRAAKRRFPVIPSRTKSKTRFYRSISHRPMRLSESPLSETDDEIDDAWRREKHVAELREMDGISEPVQRFMIAWDGHVLAEGCPNGRYVADTVVRFVRRQGRMLQEEGMMLVFVGFLGELMGMSVVDEAVMRGCLELLAAEATEAAEEEAAVAAVAAAAAEERQEEDAMPQAGHAHHDASDASAGAGIMTGAAGPLLPYHDPLPVDPGECGICRTWVKRLKKSVYCTNELCETPATIYHLSCVGQEARPRAWLCAACELTALKGKTFSRSARCG